MLFAELDGQGYAVIIAAIFVGLAGVLGSIGAIITGVVTLWLQWKREEAKILRDAATAQKVEGVANALHTNTARTEEKLDVIHGLVNSAMLEQKRILAVKCRAAADENPNPVNLAEALAAEVAYNTHAAQQAEMERQKGKSPSAPKIITRPTGPITSAELKKDIADVPEKVADSPKCPVSKRQSSRVDTAGRVAGLVSYRPVRHAIEEDARVVAAKSRRKVNR